MEGKNCQYFLLLSLLLTACGNPSDTANQETTGDQVQQTTSNQETTGEQAQQTTSNTVPEDNNQLTEPTESTAPESEQPSAPPATDFVPGECPLKLTEAGTISTRLTFRGNSILTETVDGGIRLLDLNGEARNNTVYSGIESLVGGGVCIVKQDSSNEIPLLGVANAYTGEEYISCEAVDIWMLSERYLLVCYMTEITTEDAHFGFFHDKNSNELVYYDGYGKVLDLKEGQIVPGVEVFTSYLDISAAGQMLFVDTETYAVSNVYYPDGKLLGTYEYLNVYPESDLVLQSLAEGVTVYDGNMQEVSQLPGSIYDYQTIDGINNMLIKSAYTNNTKSQYLIDLQGKELSEHYPRICSAAYADKYIAFQESNLLGILDLEGNEIIPAAYNAINYYEPGYFIAKNDNGYYAFDLAGKQLNEEPAAVQKGGLVLTDSSEKSFLILDAGCYYDNNMYVKLICKSLILVDDALIDVISGQTVLENVDGCASVGDSLYVWDDDTSTYTRYIVEYIR